MACAVSTCILSACSGVKFEFAFELSTTVLAVPTAGFWALPALIALTLLFLTVSAAASLPWLVDFGVVLFFLRPVFLDAVSDD